MNQDLYRFRLITNNNDGHEWEPFRLRQHLEALTGVRPEVQTKAFPEVNPMHQSGFEVRIRVDLDTALRFYVQVKQQFVFEQL